MLTRIYLGLVLLVAVPAWAQVEPSATGPPPSSEDAMQTPPPISGLTYPAATGSEARSNYLRAGLNFQTAYDDNLLPENPSKPVGEEIYSIASSFALDQSTPRTHRMFSYNPNFTLYVPTSALNALNQSATANFQYRLSPHATVNVQDTFAQTSNVFDQPYAGVPGSTQPSTQEVVAPFADQRGNGASAQISYQFSTNGMIGGGGTSSIVDYLNPAQAQGLSNSNSLGGSAFYNLRLSSKQYIGGIYQYSKMTASVPVGSSDSNLNSIFATYTFYLSPSFSMSVSGGPQHFDIVEPPFPLFASWTPSVTASIGCQRSRTSFAVSYSKTVTGAGGLVGAFHSDGANASIRWQLLRSWTLGLATSYANQKNVIPGLSLPSEGGHTLSGTVSVQHPISEHVGVQLGYVRLNQSYRAIAVISENPDLDRAYISISYQFTRPLGR
jgi:hypothetical protein